MICVYVYVYIYIYIYTYILILNLDIIFSFMPTPRTSCSFQSCYRGGFGVGCGLCISWFRWWLSTELYAGTKLERFGWWSLEVFVEGIVAKEGSGKCWMFLCIARIVMKVFVDICMFIWDSKIYIYTRYTLYTSNYIFDHSCISIHTPWHIPIPLWIQPHRYKLTSCIFVHIDKPVLPVVQIFIYLSHFICWKQWLPHVFQMFQPKCVAPDVWKKHHIPVGSKIYLFAFQLTT